MLSRAVGVGAVGALALLLTGCSFSFSVGNGSDVDEGTETKSYTVTSSEIADLAAKSLKEAVGLLPELDCGTGDVPVSEGFTVNCVLTAPDTGSEFETTVEIKDVDGSKYSIDVEVAEQPTTPE